MFIVTEYAALTILLHRGYYMSAHVLLNLLNKLGKSDKMWNLAERFITFSQQV